MIRANLEEAIEKAIKPQAMVGNKWGSGDATTSRHKGQSAINAIQDSHWHNCVWFRGSPNDFWIKASGYRPMTRVEKIQHNNSYRYHKQKRRNT